MFQGKALLPAIPLILILGCGSGSSPSGSETDAAGTKLRRGTSCLIRLPDDYDSERSYPLLFCLHPGGQAKDYLRHLAPLAEEGRCILAASTAYRNGQPHTRFLSPVRRAIDDIELEYPIRSDAIYLAGFSGGGMAAFVTAHFDPGRFAGVISNGGALHEKLESPTALKATALKSVVFLAGTKDRVVPEAHLRGNAALVESAGIPLRFFSFEKGHELAPVALYRKAMAWFLEG